MATDHDNTLSKATTKNQLKPPPTIKNGWFTETETFWPGQKFSLALEEFSSDSILFHAQSDFQQILVFQSAQYGTTLVLDGVIQLTERDEYSYHEMMTHIPLCSHANPRRVLIVGGGDGGILREVCRHDCVQEIVMVEIDALVIDVCRRYFGQSTAVAFDDPRVTIVHADAAQYLQQHHEANYFDVILGDTSDPVGPAATLFQPAFYESMHAVLSNDGGIICMQAECFWIHLSLISDMIACCADIFDTAEYATTLVPTYPCGQIGFLLASKQQQQSVATPKRTTLRKPLRIPNFLSDLQWYSPRQHRAAFTLPPFVERELTPLQHNRNVTSLEDDDDYVDDENDSKEYRCILEHAPSCTLL